MEDPRPSANVGREVEKSYGKVGAQSQLSELDWLTYPKILYRAKSREPSAAQQFLHASG
jgi:hypothetical protein